MPLLGPRRMVRTTPTNKFTCQWRQASQLEIWRGNIIYHVAAVAWQLCLSIRLVYGHGKSLSPAGIQRYAYQYTEWCVRAPTETGRTAEVSFIFASPSPTVPNISKRIIYTKTSHKLSGKYYFTVDTYNDGLFKLLDELSATC